ELHPIHGFRIPPKRHLQGWMDTSLQSPLARNLDLYRCTLDAAPVIAHGSTHAPLDFGALFLSADVTAILLLY
ncbi:MAG: hypothetical protein WAM71_07010, partial [Candidatus Korobacteraceae bacterium]